jgi:hypothetical protein
MTTAASFEVIAGDTLVSFSGTAMEWPVNIEIRPTEPGHSTGEGIDQAHLVCSQCEQSVLPLSLEVGRRAYVHTPLRIAAAVLRHIREVHCDGGGILA